MMMGYDFLNSKADQYWQDGKSTETDYIYILNSTVSEKQLEKYQSIWRKFFSFMLQHLTEI